MRLIDADALIEKIRSIWRMESEPEHKSVTWKCAMADAVILVLSVIAKMLPIDAEPVRHGRWIETNKPGWVNGQFYETPRLVCPFCTREAAHYSVEEAEQGGRVTTVLWLRTDYCPNCGAKMDGGDHHD